MQTIANWYDNDNPKITEWLKEKLITREKDKENAKSKKLEVINLAKELNTCK